MTYRNKQLRPGATAIAAVLALSTPPLLAQDMGTQPVVTLPTPAPPTAAPAPTLPTPAAPTVRAMTPAPAPVIVPEASAETRAAPVARTRAATTTRRAQTVTRSAAPAAPAVAQAEPLAPAPVVPLAETPVIEPAPVMAEAVPAPVEPVAAESGGEVLPIVGGAAGLLLLAGGAYALSRRRRNAGEEDYTAETWEQDHVTYAEPAFAEPAVTEPAWREPLPVAAPAMAAVLPAGMDLSRYGRHVQAAYAGPTPDNPSLSLKRRLKRAAFFDQRERMAREAGEPSDMLQPIASAQATQTTAPRADQLVTSRRVSPKAGTQALFGFRPAFQN